MADSVKDQVQKMRDAKQAELDLVTGQMKDIDTLEQSIADEQKTAVAAAENAILASVGQLNGDGKLYSDKEWNDREDEIKAEKEALNTKIADLGAQIDAAKPDLDAAKDRADKAEAKLAKAKSAYEAEQEAESKLEAVGNIFAEDEVETAPTSGPDVSETT